MRRSMKPRSSGRIGSLSVWKQMQKTEDSLSSLIGVYGLITGFSASGALNFVMMAAILISRRSTRCWPDPLDILTSNVQAADLVLLRQFEPETLGIVIDSLDV